MKKVRTLFAAGFAGVLAIVLSPLGTPAKKEVARDGPAVMWRQPQNIGARNLFFGPGGKEHQPKGPFEFRKEDTGGTNTKFEVKDAAGVIWNVKMDEEAAPETAAVRLLWAAGYFAGENYYLPVMQVQNMKHLSRGNSKVSRDGTVKNVRLKRHLENQQKVGSWQWGDNPFKNTREWNGLRVMMALLNNWDLKDANNSIYQVRGEHPEQHYYVSDLGASFGPTALGHGKNDPEAYAHSKWMGKVTTDTVDFNIPGSPAWPRLFNPTETRRLGFRWIGRGIPVADARWLGQLLAQLSSEQIRDAFRASGYTPQQVELLSAELQRRIGTLAAL